MAVLGEQGCVRFRREAPEPVVIPGSALRADNDALLLNSTEFWNGDEVYITSPNGLPLSPYTLPDGVGCYYGSYWDLGPNRIHVTAETDQYYVTGDDTVYFYNRGVPQHTATYFIYRDQLGRVSFYTSRKAALNGSYRERINLSQLDFKYIVMAAAGTSEYNNAISDCSDELGAYRFSDVAEEVTLISICEYAPRYEQPPAGTADYDNADVAPRRWAGGFPWLIQGDLREWSIELSGDNINTTAVGQKFGESVKSVVSGGGSFDFLVDRRAEEYSQDATALFQLLLMTEKGAKAEAEFYMITDRAESCGGLAAGDLYYKCELLVTQIAVNTRATDVIAGTAQFVTTGVIELKMGR